MRRRPDGATEGDHLRSAIAQFEKLGAKIPEELADALQAQTLPSQLAYLLEYFWELLSGCENKITWSDMRDWSDLRRIELQAWESDVLMRIAGEYLKSLAPAPQIPES